MPGVICDAAQPDDERARTRSATRRMRALTQGPDHAGYALDLDRMATKRDRKGTTASPNATRRSGLRLAAARRITLQELVAARVAGARVVRLRITRRFVCLETRIAGVARLRVEAGAPAVRTLRSALARRAHAVVPIRVELGERARSLSFATRVASALRRLPCTRARRRRWRG